MMPVDGLLVAAGLDWLEGLLPVLFVLIWIFSQVMNLFRGAAKAPAAAPAAPPKRRPLPRPDAEEIDLENEPLDGEIREFLRRTLEGQVRPQPTPTQVKPPRPPARRPAAAPAKQAGSRPASAPVARDNVAGHVATAFAHDLAHQAPDRIAAMQPRGAESAPASELLAALRAPGGLRQLILMREVLERPTQRW